MRRILKLIIYPALALGLLGGAFAYGFLVNLKELPPYETVWQAYVTLVPWVHRGLNLVRPAPVPEAPRESDEALTEAQLKEIERLRAIGYLSGTQPATARSSSVTLHQPELAYQGTNLVTDAHRPEARLLTMSGELLHRWSVTFEVAFPGVEVPTRGRGAYAWRRVHPFDNGDLLAIFEGHGLVKIGRDSRVLWSYDGQAHHDLEVAENGEIYVLTRRAELVPRINDELPVLHDFVTVLSPDGAELRHVSILEAIERSPYASLLANMPREGSLLHTNTLELLDGRLADRLPAFKAGNVLISMLNLDAIAVVDMSEEKVVWSWSGLWVAQHQPTVLDNGHLMVFDNRGARGWSRVLEIDPVTQEIAWSYDGRKPRMRTKWCGSSQRLANGNTLITESDQGRAIEVRPDQTTVWEYRTPHRVGEHGTLVATLFEVIRLDPEFPLDWLSGASG